jgi:drug/metabolite transporter (DMT)-like permease
VASAKPTHDSSQQRGAAFGLAAAALFGISTPLAKVLLGSTAPQLLAGLLYLGAGAAISLYRLFRTRSSEARLRAEDVPLLLLVALFGGVFAPVLMLLGLARLSAVAGSLLLNLEAPFTMLLAVVFFKEHLGRRALLAALLIVAGAVLLRVDAGALEGQALGMALVAAACACWALDNNLTQRLSTQDPFAIVQVKTLVAGLANLAIALVTGAMLPAAAVIAGALLLGSLSYGLSVVLDAYALRLIGAAREAAYFATAPFVGALGSVILLQESLGRFDVVALIAMVAGVALLWRERHSHRHRHEPLRHDHLHSHDQHHDHAHAPNHPPGSPHSHWHEHEPLEHDHPHVPDVHHRHRH